MHLHLSGAADSASGCAACEIIKQLFVFVFVSFVHGSICICMLLLTLLQVVQLCRIINSSGRKPFNTRYRC